MEALACNGKTLRKDTEPNLVLAPGAYWRKFLQPKLEKLARNKLRAWDSAEVDDTDVTVSVRDRSERDLVKCFDGFDVHWSLIERQLCGWAARCGTSLGTTVDLERTLPTDAVSRAALPSRALLLARYRREEAL